MADFEMDVQILVVEAELTTLELFVDKIEKAIISGHHGIVFSDSPTAAAWILPKVNVSSDDLPLSIEGKFVGIDFPKGLVSGRSGATISSDADGKLTVINRKRIFFDEISSPRFNSVLNSFKDAAGQIPSDGVGVICIELDVSNVSGDRVETYMSLIMELLAVKVWKGQNLRVEGIHLYSSPIPSTTVVNNLNYHSVYRKTLTRSRCDSQSSSFAIAHSSIISMLSLCMDKAT